MSLRTLDACRLVGIASSLVNEAVHAGHYVGPSTTKGRARRYDRHHLVGLHVFAVLLDFGLRRADAGKHAAHAEARSRRIGDMTEFAIEVQAQSGVAALVITIKVPEFSTVSQVP